jgi:spermidine synthase
MTTPPPTPAQKDWLWRPALIVFVSNVCIMVIELVAGRMVAPIIGVSLYTWTSIIGVILAGISLGNFIGGKVADRMASRRTLGIIFILAGLGALSVLFTVEALARSGLPTLSWMPLIGRMVVFITAIYFLPSAMLGLISPVVIKLTLLDLKATGNVIGRIYAASALGSIVGTFATGYFLISAFGTRIISLGVAALLIFMGLLLGQWLRRPAVAAAAAMIIAVAGSVGFTQAEGLRKYMDSGCTTESNYFCIKVRDETQDGKLYKVLSLDALVHSYNSLDNPRELRYAYEQVGAEVAEFLQKRDSRIDMLLIGGGGYTLPRYLESVYPGVNIDVAEIDPTVTATAYNSLGLARDARTVSYNEDARQFLVTLDPAKKYNYVHGDAFNDFSVPYHLTTREFNELVKRHLTPNGIYLTNIIDGRDLPFARALMRTMKATFAHVYFVPTNKAYRDIRANTMLVLATDSPLDTRALAALNGHDERSQFGAWLIDDAELEAWLGTGPQFLLTDDYVPTDNLLTGVFEVKLAVPSP